MDSARRLVLALSVLSYVVLLGCSDTGGSSGGSDTGSRSPMETSASRGAPELRLLEWGGSGVSYQALVSGRLKINAKNCFVLRAGSVSSVIVAPPNSTIVGNGSGIKLPGYGHIRVGDKATLVGGYSESVTVESAITCTSNGGGEAFVVIAPAEHPGPAGDPDSS